MKDAMDETLTFESVHESSFKTLLKVSDALTGNSGLETTLRSIACLLPSVISLDMLAIGLRNANGRGARYYAIEPSQFPTADAGWEVVEDPEFESAVLDLQQPIAIEDVNNDTRFPTALNRVRRLGIRSLCVFPMSTPRRRIGAMSFGTTQLKSYSEGDLEIMRRVVANLAVLVENAINFEDARARQVQLERERDRLALLLEINNAIISQLTLKDLVIAVSASIRRRFQHNYTGIWTLVNHNKLKCSGLDFPDGQGFIEGFEPELDAQQMQELQVLVPHVSTRKDIEKLPESIAGPMLREQIACSVVVPLRTARRFLGVLSLGSVREECFRDDDLPLLKQIGGQVSLAIENAIAFRDLAESRDQLESEKFYLQSEIRADCNFEDIIGKSSVIKHALEQVAIVAQTDATVLLLGETGTGKELFARAIHNLSDREARTFVRLNCASFPSGLVESELFGHERGAFTGALTQKIGRFELANKGTLFLDEIGDIPLELQTKLLRTLQEREFERLGSTKTIKVDVRLIAATNRNLPEMIRNGQFREDLFYRLNVFPIHIPPLRERTEDIPLLVRHFVAKFSRQMRKEISGIPSSALAVMSKMRWPGNIRELENLIERAVILSRGETLQIPLSELEFEEASRTPPTRQLGKPSLGEIERSALLEALRKTKGRISGPDGAAALLGLKRTTFHSKMRRYKILRTDF